MQRFFWQRRLFTCGRHLSDIHRYRRGCQLLCIATAVRANIYRACAWSIANSVRYDTSLIANVNLCLRSNCLCFLHQGGKYGIRLSLGAQECDVYDNVMSDSTRYGVFFYRGSDEAEVSYLLNLARGGLLLIMLGTARMKLPRSVKIVSYECS